MDSEEHNLKVRKITSSKVQEEKKDFLLQNKQNKELEKMEDIDFILEHIVGGGQWKDFGQWVLFMSII